MVSPSTQLRPELQFARCMSNRYRNEEFPRCVSCTRRWAGDTCRFQGIRFFLKDEKKNIVGISFVESHKPDGPSMHFPGQWNIPLKDHYIRRLKVIDATLSCRFYCFDSYPIFWRNSAHSSGGFATYSETRKRAHAETRGHPKAEGKRGSCHVR